MQVPALFAAGLPVKTVWPAILDIYSKKIQRNVWIFALDNISSKIIPGACRATKLVPCALVTPAISAQTASTVIIL